MIPVIAFGNGTLKKNHVKFKGHKVGLTDVLYTELKKKQKSGEAIIALVDEYRTSMASILRHT
ncbi:hypothetical protein BCV72DRAFT_25648 [Rhizopus microsporus var. microsporus]|uniref:Uncharacterized protein n=1 Tax=Rhizopus microsporus var. microsporus TaxID=86635 RepID=A0A1X0QVK9_RHIZD|nr:hypothetical protein BCV72DRAFT_25648 [Rhizopus microsporus var. microsporus]